MAHTTAGPQAGPRIKAVFFDFMGTCLDWHSSVTAAFPDALSAAEKSDLALAWRLAFFDDIRRRPLEALPEPIDKAHARLLRDLLGAAPNADVRRRFVGDDGEDAAVARAVAAWHRMAAWPDVAAGLARVRALCGDDCDLIVLANGTTRLQLDLARSSGLRFDLLLSSELLGAAKPAPAAYRKALALVGLDPDRREDAAQAVLVAAHAYDLRAARAVGMQTVYVQRWTDDYNDAQAATDLAWLRAEHDLQILPDFDRLAEAVLALSGAARGLLTREDGTKK